MKILFVDDEETIRDLFFEYFKDEFQVTMASDGLEAFELASKSQFDLIISDISLPKLNGIQFIQKIRALGNRTPFLIITGDSDIQLAIDIFRMGAVDLFLKPFKMVALRSRIKKFETADIDIVSLYSTGEVSNFNGEYKFSIKPQIKKINSYVGMITQHIANSPISENEDLIPIKIVLYELLANAIEHGVAGMSYSQKQKCLESNIDYLKLVDEHCKTANRFVHVTLHLDDFGITIIISDDGNGFSLQDVPNPIENPAANLVSGRGIFLAKMNIESIVYNEKGNEVRLFKPWTIKSAKLNQN
ncbi:MAG: response regulator [Leptospira sp.]|nr:response regulator [Leptospira sp.]